jgi:hypothetical protein
MKLLKQMGAAALTAMLSATVSALPYTDEAQWRSAVGNVYALETFDSIAAGSDVNSLAALGLRFDALDDGTQPTVQRYSQTGGTVRSGPNNLLNDRDFDLPGRGAYTMRPINSNDLLFGVGVWNVGGDDQLRMTFYTASGMVLEQVVSSSGTGFFGIVNSAGAARIVIDFVGGNGYAPIDDLQSAVRTTFNPGGNVPLPSMFLLFGLALAGLGWVRRTRAK